MLGDHGEAIEADLLAHFNVDIRELGQPSLTWRRLRVLIEHLPADSSLARAVTDEKPEERVWDMTTQLLAAVYDQAGWTNYLLGALIAQNNSKMKSNPIPEPKPIPRPGVKADNARRGKGMKSLVRALGAPV